MIIRRSTRLSTFSRTHASRLPERTGMKKALRKSIAVAVLLMILALSATAINTPLVRADAGGTGKYLTVNIVGEGNVTATKVESGQYWEFSDNGTEKVGAGTILLQAIAEVGWDFSHWEEDLAGISNPTTDYRTKKYGNVTAIFVKTTYTITAIAIGPGTINGEIKLTVEVEHGGASPTFVFAPDNETLHHISSIKIDNNYTDYMTEYTFPDPITSNHDIVVTFDDIGAVTVPADLNAQIFVDPIASVMFNNTDGGILFGIALQFPEGTSIALYDMTTNATDVDGLVIITIQLNGSVPVAVYRADTADILYSDVFPDGVIDGTDVSLVANAIRSLAPHGLYDPEFDVDRNMVLDQHDIHTVNENKGATLTALNWWVEGDTLFISNDHWCTFRAR